MNVDERMKEIIEGFSKLGLEEMERILIKLGIPTDRKIGSDKNGRTYQRCKTNDGFNGKESFQ